MISSHLFVPTWNNNLPPSRKFLRDKKLLKKKLDRENAYWTNYWIWIEGALAPGRTCTPKTGYFHDKTKISLANLRVNYYLPLKLGNVRCFLSSGPSHLQNLTQKCKVLNVSWSWLVRKGKTEQFTFFNWLSNLKNLVVSNGSKMCEMWSKWHWNCYLYQKLQKIAKGPVYNNFEINYSSLVLFSI